MPRAGRPKHYQAFDRAWQGMSQERACPKSEPVPRMFEGMSHHVPRAGLSQTFQKAFISFYFCFFLRLHRLVHACSSYFFFRFMHFSAALNRHPPLCVPRCSSGFSHVLSGFFCMGFFLFYLLSAAPIPTFGGAVTTPARSAILIRSKMSQLQRQHHPTSSHTSSTSTVNDM